MIRTRFAPSPTGYLHVGSARTALFSWAFARKHGGQFILRIEDTDAERSTSQSVDAILESMQWLGLDYDEGPYYQSRRLERYREAAHKLIASGNAYHCYATREELDALREQQRAQGVKPRYDGHWRDSRNTPPPGVPPVVRFKNPLHGEVAFRDLVKGEIKVANDELDDLVIVRADGTPTYNFGVVVDDLDMNITHVIRGDDHVNNTPRQINILNALGAPLPQYAHVPMILGHDGERLSKRHGAVSVTQYRDDGYLADALINYLARLGWSHGDDEIFSREQLIEWFDFRAVSKSPARFDPDKLTWLNQQHIKKLPPPAYAQLVVPRIEAAHPNQRVRPEGVALFRDRVAPDEIVEATKYLYVRPTPSPDLVSKHYSATTKAALADLYGRFVKIPWERHAIHDALRAVARERNLKLGQLAMPLRVMVTGTTETPSIDAILELIGRDEVLARVQNELAKFPG